MTDENAREFVIAWYLAVFVWGFIINLLRIYIVSQFAPIRGEEILAKYKELPQLVYNEERSKLIGIIEE